MYNYEIKTSYVSPEMPMVWANKTGFNFIIVHFYFRRKLDIKRYETVRNMIFIMAENRF